MERQSPMTLPSSYRQESSNRNVSVVAGSNTNEGSAFAYLSVGGKGTISDYKKFIILLLGHGNPVPTKVVDKVLKMYPGSSSPGVANRVMAGDFLGDLGFICPSRHVIRLLGTFSRKPVYRFRFNYVAKDDPEPKVMGVQHGSEVPFVFDAGSWIGWKSKFTPQEESFAHQIGAAWAHFADTGAPPMGWPTYNNKTDEQPILAPGKWKTEDNWRSSYCEFWDHFCDNHFCDSFRPHELLHPNVPFGLPLGPAKGGPTIQQASRTTQTLV